jgi:hypothetical protein
MMKTNDAQKSEDSDADTIRMTSFEFWNGVDAEDVPVIPQNLILTESTSVSKYKNYTGCQRFNCTHFSQYRESTSAQRAKGKCG